MKKFILMMCLVCVSVCAMAHDTKDSVERVKPTFGVTLDRKCYYIKIEKELYSDVTIELKAADLDAVFTTGVKIIVKDGKGKKIYKKRFEKSYLYYFPSNGSIEVGKGNALTQVLIFKNSATGDWLAAIREKGLYK